MIFVTVGYQMAFDRLIVAIDDWAGEHPDAEIHAQIGPTDLQPRNLPWTDFMDPGEFERRARECSVMVAHAGMGSILTALEHGKPIVVMPRRGGLGETRNDHQMATARKFADRAGIHVAFDEAELLVALNRLEALGGSTATPSVASPQLLDHLKAFIHGKP